MLRRLLGRRSVAEPTESSAPPTDPDAKAPGWDAISREFARLYPRQEPIHRAPIPGLAFGGGLQGVSAYRAPDHWHFVTYGLSELWTKEQGSDPEVSGWGYELTMRVAARGESAIPPDWAFNVLHQAALVTRTERKIHRPGDRIQFSEPQALPDGTMLEGLAVAEDPQLPALVTENGRLAFHQLIRATSLELDQMRSDGTDAVLSRWKRTDPLLVR